MKQVETLDYFRGRRVFLTGHTGFKGAWLSRILIGLGAELSAYALAPPPGPALYHLAEVDGQINSTIGDIRDRERLWAALKTARPQVVIHMAAQPLVRAGYQNPAETYEVNVMGTVNLLESLRRYGQAESFVNVTTDKVYQNDETGRPFGEDQPLGGYDPYSNSKSCSELVSAAYKKSFLDQAGCAVSTVRSGNVIGGGDFALDRIVPDCVRAALKGEKILIRHPDSTRPYQHVLEPLAAYLTIAAGQALNPETAGVYNVGPEASGCAQTKALVQEFCRLWGQGQDWETRPDNGPPEAGCLRLDPALIGRVFGWRPRWNLTQALALTVDWTKAWAAGEDLPGLMDQQIDLLMRGATKPPLD